MSLLGRTGIVESEPEPVLIFHVTADDVPHVHTQKIPTWSSRVGGIVLEQPDTDVQPKMYNGGSWGWGVVSWDIGWMSAPIFYTGKKFSLEAWVYWAMYEAPGKVVVSNGDPVTSSGYGLGYNPSSYVKAAWLGGTQYSNNGSGYGDRNSLIRWTYDESASPKSRAFIRFAPSFGAPMGAYQETTLSLPDDPVISPTGLFYLFNPNPSYCCPSVLLVKEIKMWNYVDIPI